VVKSHAGVDAGTRRKAFTGKVTPLEEPTQAGEGLVQRRRKEK